MKARAQFVDFSASSLKDEDGKNATAWTIIPVIRSSLIFIYLKITLLNCVLNYLFLTRSNTLALEADLVQVSVDVPSEFHGAIIGKRGDTKRRLEEETGTRIDVPKMGAKSSSVVIRGGHRHLRVSLSIWIVL